MTKANRYAPPTAPVADLPAHPALQSRPQQVRVAVALLWSSLALAIPSWILSAVRNPATYLGSTVVAVTICMFALSAFLNTMVYKGKNWARITSLVLTLLTASLMLVPADDPVPPGRVENALLVVEFILEFAALYLLFVKPGSLWFRRET